MAILDTKHLGFSLSTCNGQVSSLPSKTKSENVDFLPNWKEFLDSADCHIHRLCVDTQEHLLATPTYTLGRAPCATDNVVCCHCTCCTSTRLLRWCGWFGREGKRWGCCGRLVTGQNGNVWAAIELLLRATPSTCCAVRVSTPAVSCNIGCKRDPWPVSWL